MERRLREPRCGPPSTQVEAALSAHDSRAAGAGRLRGAREHLGYPLPVPARAFRLAVVAVAAALASLPACRARPPRNVVIVTIDTLRRDRVSAYGYTRPTTPEVDALGARGVVFEDAWSQAPNTNESLASTLTSRRAPVTTVRGLAERLDPGVPTIASSARAAGFRTGAFVSSVVLQARYSGLDAGFDVYDDTQTDPCFGHENAQRVAQRTVDAALAWLGQADARPFLLWVHLYDPHGPYTPPEPTPELDATAPVLPEGAVAATWQGPAHIPKYLRVPGVTEPLAYADAYDREIRYADRHLGRLFAALDPATTYVLVHSDHGEAHGEDAYWFRHGALLHDPALRIPMLLAGPGIPAGRRVTARVRNLDVVPTLCALAGLRAPADAEGRDLSDVVTGSRDTAPGDDWFVAEAHRREATGDDTGIDVRWKLRYVDGARADLVWWPALDRRAVARGTGADVVTAMERMRAWLLGPDDPLPDVLPDATEDALRGLGYTAPSETVSPPSPSPSASPPSRR